MKIWIHILGILGLLAGGCESRETHSEESSAKMLSVVEQEITVKGQKVKVFAIVQEDGKMGLRLEKGQDFDVLLQNKLHVPTSVHWHGLILPNDEDGVAFITQYPIYPGSHYLYQFPILQSGTFWMHAHFSMQEQQLLEAPLILRDPAEKNLADQEVIMLLSDFSFRSPEEIYADLRCKKVDMQSMSKPDIADVEYDAFLSNRRTLEDPEIIPVEPGKKIRLRIINGASGTNFFLSTGALPGEAIAVDGNRIQPLTDSHFELAAAQRIDILVTIPPEGGVFPILAQGAGTAMQTGLILATQDATIPAFSSQAASTAGALTNAQEVLFTPLVPPESKPFDKRILLELGGTMNGYIWTINKQAWPNSTPVVIELGQRIEILFKNTSMMAHPMHLHGHVFQVVAVGNQRIQGALRDTVLVPANSSVSIQFDADNHGVWPLHCHILYHQIAGMATVVRYKDFVQPLTP